MRLFCNKRDSGAKKLLSPTRMADKIVMVERKAILARLPKVKRHSSKTKPAWKDPATAYAVRGARG